MMHKADTVNLPSANPTPESRTLNLRTTPTSAFGSRHLAITNPAELRFGVAPKPLVTRRGLNIGGGLVYPEINFTLPPMFVNESTMPDVRMQYQQIITGVLHRAVELEAPG